MDFLTPEEALQLNFETISPGTAWGHTWEYCWLHGKITLPAEAEGHRIVMDLNTGGETTVFVNGKSFGRKKRAVNGCMYRFKAIYEDGEITAVSYNENGAEIGRYSLKTAGEESALRVIPEEASVKAGGLSFVRLQYTDNEGVWQPQGIHHLKVNVENGELLGLGSANPYVKGNYTEDTVRTYFGEAMAVVRAGEYGTVRVTVTDESGETVCGIPVV